MGKILYNDEGCAVYMGCELQVWLGKSRRWRWVVRGECKKLKMGLDKEGDSVSCGGAKLQARQAAKKIHASAALLSGAAG